MIHKIIENSIRTASKISWVWGVLLVGMLALAACDTPSRAPQTREDVTRIAPAELKSRLDSGDEVLVVDARSAGEFQQRHIPGAISVPYNEVEARLNELPRDQDIVFYCT